MNDYTNLKKIPYPSVLDLGPLVEFWEQKLKNEVNSPFAVQFLSMLANATVLRGPLVDAAVLDEHKELIDFMMGAVIPYAGGESDLAAAIVPFRQEAFYSTAAFDTAIPLMDLDQVATIDVPGNRFATAATLKASLLILKQFYSVDFDSEMPVLATIRDPGTGLEKVFKVTVDDRFCRVVSLGAPDPIEPSVIKFLTERMNDLDLMLQYIKPENFEFRGFQILRMTDVTQEEMLSSIKHDLLTKDAVVNTDSFRTIQQKLRSIFNLPDLMLGLAYFDPNNNLVLNSGHENCWKSIAEKTPGDCDYAGSVYERSWMEKRYVTIENLEAYPFKSKIENSLLANGIKSMLLAPLVDEGETIGLLELASTQINKLNPLSGARVENVLPMFTVAVKRVKSDMETEVRALIQEECTAIHPAVQWRFFEAGMRLLNRRRKEPEAPLEEIVFNRVYPFFGMIDIRNSSLERNQAIQQDIRENLNMARELLERLFLEMRLPLLEELIFRTSNHISSLDRHMASGDEINVLDFLRRDVNPVLDHFEADAAVGSWIKAYKSALDPASGVIYKRRKAFEDSLNAINSFVGGLVDQADDAAQKMFPHYFEKYKTDGVEFNLYLGESLLENRKFNEFYLRNFRLWQLTLMCSIEQQMGQFKPTLENPLDVTQLILVHDQPVTIRFRPDEKRFDVDGAYDIRYEIVKKRIDKAMVKDGLERLTQPGKIAIVYTQAKNADEYREYFNHLRNKGLITPEVEDLELEELPGAMGLRALRVTVAGGHKHVSEISHAALLKHIEEALELDQ